MVPSAGGALAPLVLSVPKGKMEGTFLLVAECNAPVSSGKRILTFQWRGFSGGGGSGEGTELGRGRKGQKEDWAQEGTGTEAAVES